MVLIQLPWPPSVNRYWRRVGNKTLLSAEGRIYKENVSIICIANRITPTDGRIRVAIMAYPPDKRKRDIDNIAKAILDGLAGHAYEDDEQIDELIITRKAETKGGSVTILVSRL